MFVSSIYILLTKRIALQVCLPPSVPNFLGWVTYSAALEVFCYEDVSDILPYSDIGHYCPHGDASVILSYYDVGHTIAFPEH